MWGSQSSLLCSLALPGHWEGNVALSSHPPWEITHLHSCELYESWIHTRTWLSYSAVPAGWRTGWHGSHVQQDPAVWIHLLSKTENLWKPQITLATLEVHDAASMQKTCQKLWHTLKGMTLIQSSWQLPTGQRHSFDSQRCMSRPRNWATFLEFPYLLLSSQALPILPEGAPLMWMGQLPGQICLSTCRPATLTAATSHHHIWGFRLAPLQTHWFSFSSIFVISIL